MHGKEQKPENAADAPAAEVDGADGPQGRFLQMAGGDPTRARMLMRRARQRRVASPAVEAQIVGERGAPPPAPAAEEFTGAAFEELRTKILDNPAFRAVAEKNLGGLEKTKKAQHEYRIGLANRLEALRRGMKWVPDEDLNPSLWRALVEQLHQSFVENPQNLGRKLVALLIANAQKSNELRHEMEERGEPLGMTFTPIAVGVGDTVENMSNEIEEVKNELERALEAEKKTDGALHLLRAALGLGKAGLDAYSLVQPVAALTDAGPAGLTPSAVAVNGSGAATATTTPAAIGSVAPGGAARLVAGLGDHAGDNPAAEDKSVHEGDRQQQQKTEKKDARDAEPRSGQSGDKAKRTPLARNIPPPGPTFDDWFDALSPDALAKLLADEGEGLINARRVIQDAIRHPGGYHEWLMVKHVQKFKEWGVSMKLIKEARTMTTETLGQSFKHGGRGSGTMHLQLSKMIDSSGSFGEFLEKLNNWADDALYAGKGEPGRLKLPPDLRR